ncbi:class I SAM-dependent methyltransferase [Roseospirillum parvum]|uniref:Methyltransferase domain-containing protein n=1 Tax=Roseospirillum parvum TaxID=83401 RepID=A0A1G8C6Y2_9PROT|nr:class I SAM-dependent methyltransferase [Roseospirillum parvum]SDH40680.1 Methyltransferase domain-containing protein [Roseospirillum parvum]
MTTTSPDPLDGPPRTGLSDRLVDAIARRPNGLIGRALYRRPVGHMAGFRKGLAAAPVGPQDRVLDVGCGGGVFLEMALAGGCRASGLDHSPDMVRETKRRNAHALAEGRLEVVQGDAADLPFADAAFSHVFCLHAFFFFPQPDKAIAEMARVLAPGGRLVIVTAPLESAERMHRIFGPIARRMRFDTPEALARWAEAGGLVAEGTIDPQAADMLFIARRPTTT